MRFTGSFHPADGGSAQTMESVTLSVYRDQKGGTALWHEIQNVVVDADGHYSALMGATQNDGMPIELFASREPRWLGVQFNRPGEAEQPRVLLVSVPYALKASDAETLGGKPASAYLLAAPVVGTSAAAATTPVKPKAAPANSGQPNYIGKFTNTTDLIDSAMYEVNGNVGISTTAPAISLDVRTGALPQMGIAGTTDYLTFFASDKFGPAIYWDPAKDLRFGKGGTGLYNPFGFVEYMRIQSSTGKVGIGTSAPTAQLEVDSGNSVAAILGFSSTTNGTQAGVLGETANGQAYGVQGYNGAFSGPAVAVYGISNIGIGVQGTSFAASDDAYPFGVEGITYASNGIGVFGSAMVQLYVAPNNGKQRTETIDGLIDQSECVSLHMGTSSSCPSYVSVFRTAVTEQ